MIDALLLHPATRRTLDALLHSHAHALVVFGQPGAGKYTLVRAIAADTLGVTPDKLVNTAGYYEVLPESKSVLIEQVRGVQHFLTLKTPGKGNIRRVVAIFDADTMASDAQNALLKTLEEPPFDTLIILSAAQIEDLLPTIRSRVQLLYVSGVTQTDAREYFATHGGFAPAVIDKAYALSAGNVGLLSTLLNNESNELADSVDLAKSLFGETMFERLARVDELSKQKEQIGGLLVAMKRICTTALEQSAVQSQGPKVASWHSRLELVLAAESSFRKSANPKLLLTDLFLNL